MSEELCSTDELMECLHRTDEAFANARPSLGARIALGENLIRTALRELSAEQRAEVLAYLQQQLAGERAKLPKRRTAKSIRKVRGMPRTSLLIH